MLKIGLIRLSEQSKPPSSVVTACSVKSNQISCLTKIDLPWRSYAVAKVMI